MPKLTFILSVVIVSVFSYCTSNKEQNSPGGYVLTPVDKSCISIDSLTPPTSYYGKFIERGKVHVDKSFWINLNPYTQNIQFYDWETKELYKKIPLEKEGPNGVGNVKGFHVHTPDSIFVVAPYQYKLSLVDSSGRLLTKYSLLPSGHSFKNGSSVPKGEGLSLLIKDSEMFFSNNSIYLLGTPNENLFTNKEIFFLEGRTALCIDLSTGNLDYFINYPDFYHEGGYPIQTFVTFFWTKQGVKDRAYISFQMSDSLYRYDLKTKKKTGAFYAGSSLIDGFDPLPNKNEHYDPDVHFNHYLKMRLYADVLYDPYREVFLRWVWLPNTDENGNSLTRDGLLIKSAIIIFDSDFNKLGEQKMPNGILAGAFATEEGIYFPMRAESEDEICFMKYELMKDGKELP